jgi:hypothetical protein
MPGWNLAVDLPNHDTVQLRLDLCFRFSIITNDYVIHLIDRTAPFTLTLSQDFYDGLATRD